MSKIGKFILPYGGSGSSPDPAIYCPANGYIIDPDLPTPPVVIIPPEETDEKIVLLCSSELENAISFLCTVSSAGQYTAKIYNMDGVLKQTITKNNNVQNDINFNTSDGTLFPDGFYRYKVIITPTVVTNSILTFALKTRTGYAINGWPAKEAHFYTPNLTSFASAFSALAHMLTYVKFYSTCDSLTTIFGAFGSCELLKEVYWPSSMNALITASSVFAGASGSKLALRIVEWPVSLPECTTMASLYRTGGLKQMTPTVNPLPSSMPKLTNMLSMFEYNNTIEDIEISNDLPKLTTASNFALWGNSLKTIKFTGTVGDPISGVNFSWLGGYNLNLVEVQYPPIIPKWILSGDPTTFKDCYNLKKITLPTNANYYGTVNTWLSYLENCISLDEVTEITTGSFEQCVKIVWNNPPKKLPTFWQPLLKLYAFSIGASSTRICALSSFECDWASVQTGNLIGAGISFIFTYCSFSTTEINRIFTALPTITVPGTIDFRNNPGYAACDKTIATAKGWTAP